VGGVEFSNTGSLDGAHWEDFTGGKAWTLSAGDGKRSVYFRVRDNAGLTSRVYSASVTVDTQVPTGSLAIGRMGQAYTNSSNVTLSINYSQVPSGILDMRFRTENTGWDNWVNASTTKQWDLNWQIPASGRVDGVKHVYCQIRSGVGHTTNLNASIILDTTTPTGSVSINGGVSYVDSPNVTLTLSASDALSGVAEVRYSSDPSFGAAAWEAYSATRAWTLSPGDGDKTVYYQVRDNAGVVSSTYSAEITLDTSPPSGSVLINGGEAKTSTTRVTLTMSVNKPTGVAKMCVYNFNDSAYFGDTDHWQTFTESKTWNLVTGDGPKKVYVQFIDHLNRKTPIYAAMITLNTTSPATSHPSEPNTGAPTVPVHWAVPLVVAVASVVGGMVIFTRRRR
jgi:hypothetical protein